MLSSTLDETGGTVTGRFDEWVATAALMMKCHRQYADERDAESKRQEDTGANGSGKNK